MAKATVVRMKPKVKLVLTNAEAQFLVNLLGKSAGTNKHSESIFNALFDVQEQGYLLEADPLDISIDENGTLRIN